MKIVKIMILVFFYSGVVAAQEKNWQDENLIMNYQNTETLQYYEDYHYEFEMISDKNVFAKYNPVSLVLSCLLYVYKNQISPQISAGCLYSPSCSSYSKRLFEDFGVLKAYFCTADRLSRCNRISATSIHSYSVDPHDHKVHESTEYYKIKE